MTGTDDDRANPDVPRRFRRYPYGPLGFRLITTVVAGIAGVLAIIRGLLGPASVAAGFVTIGVALIALAIAGYLVARWMARRGM